GLHGFFHILHRYPFFLAMKGMLASEYVWTGEAHERKPGAVCAPSYALLLWRYPCSPYRFDTIFNYLRKLIQYLFHIAVLFSYFQLIGRIWKIFYNILDRSVQQFTIRL